MPPILVYLCVVMALAIYKQRNCWHFIWQLNGWRGLIQQPFLWLLLLIYLEPKTIMSSIQRYRKYFKFPVAIIIFNRILLYVDDPMTMEAILNAPECINKTFLQNGFFVKKGLLHAKDETWKIRRKQLNPAFSHNTLVSLFGVFNRIANEVKQQLMLDIHAHPDASATAAAKEVNFKDLEDLINRAVLEVSCLTTMGHATNLTQQDEKGIAKAYKTLMELSALRILKPWYQIDFVFRWLDNENYQKAQTANKLVKEFVENIVEQKHLKWQKTLPNSAKGFFNGKHHGPKMVSNARDEVAREAKPTDSMTGGDIDTVSQNIYLSSDNITKPFPLTSSSSSSAFPLHMAQKEQHSEQHRIFIDQIFHLAQSGKLTLEDIMNEAQSMVVVSFETVSTCIIITLLCLAINHECQSKLRKEINQILTKSKKASSEKATTIDVDSRDNTDINKHAAEEETFATKASDDNINDVKRDEVRDDDVGGIHVTMEHLQSTPYLDMIINESLRLLTTVPMNLRNVSKDFQLHIKKHTRRDKDSVIHSHHPSKVSSNSSQFQLSTQQSTNTLSSSSSSSVQQHVESCLCHCIRVPKDTMIALDIFNMQRNPMYWGSNALKFYPEHFTKQNEQQLSEQLLPQTIKSDEKAKAEKTMQTLTIKEAARHPYAFIPFSKGLRTCIGHRYSISLTKIFLIKLISAFTFKTNCRLENLVFVEGVSLKFRNSEKISFEIQPVEQDEEQKYEIGEEKYYERSEINKNGGLK